MGKSIEKLLAQMRTQQRNMAFSDLELVCEHFFERRSGRGSHRVYRTPWDGDPRVNIQNDHGKAKAYQVRQVLAAVNRLRRQQEEEGRNHD